MTSGLLLCELHAHTTWSDGALTLTELVDVHGRHGFDVLCVTDHALPDGARPRGGPLRLQRPTHAHYLKAVEREARRAREQYGLLLIPGLELTYDNPDPDEAAHALAIGLRSFDPLRTADVEEALHESRRLGAAVLAAHPHGREPDPVRTTRWFWRNHDRLDGLVDRYELFNRDRTFGWIATAGLPAIAAGDFHRHEHLPTWKTLLPCPKQEDAVVAYLRSNGRAYVVPWGLRDELRGRQAA
jgi:predicted metal-dependent phosphoesterase TrpH